jgi:hypothetical protein
LLIAVMLLKRNENIRKIYTQSIIFSQMSESCHVYAI